ncbi:MAG: DotI/IcmL/TraM family protein [Gammaproteobacteria bacterium]|nr:DotI/IcmL/TraM family protein [Gammaproteobacteria bacterium]
MSREQAMHHAGGQYALHREAHLTWRRVALGLTVAVLVLAAAVAGLVSRDRPMDRAFAATPDGRVIELTPLDAPVMTQAALRSWVVTALTEAFTLGYHDYRLRLGQVREYFTDDGYRGFTEQLDVSLLLERVIEHRQVTAAVAAGAPVITRRTTWQGRAMWTLETPLLITFYAGNRQEKQELLVSTLVMRVQREERPAGIGIQQIIAERTG